MIQKPLHSNGYSVLVFDFDGTLVDSNQPKYDAFFEVAAEVGIDAAIVEQVLASHRESSRYEIVKLMLEAATGFASDRAIEELATLYGNVALEAAKQCAELPAASATLERLVSCFPLYLSSTTPETALREIVSYRQWDHHFQAIYGYPRRKAETLAKICRDREIEPSAALVIGDGQSDRDAAKACGSGFFAIEGDRPLATLVETLCR